MKGIFCFIILFLFFKTQVQAQEISPFIHVDQFGYSIQSEKVAVISNPQVGYNSNENYQVNTTLEIREAGSNDVMFSNNVSVWNNAGVHDLSGDSGWWFDFSTFNQTGSFYVFDPSTNHRSALFEISANPYLEVLKTATKTFYYNRCNFDKTEPFADARWTDTDNFFQDNSVRSASDQNNPDTERDLRGGWFDAGDYNKYVTFAHNPIHQMLTSFEDNPSIFTDDWNIPESANGIPDILDEIAWELDWLYKMINGDGSTILKMGSLDFDINDAAPPSNNIAPRYYTSTCSSASLSAASISAHAAKVYRDIPGMEMYSQNLASDAVLCWNRFLTLYEAGNLEVNCDDLTVKAGDADWNEQLQIDNALVAASYLFDLTGEQQYSTFIAENISLAEPLVNEFYSPQHIVLLEALLNYTTLDNTNAETVILIRNSVTVSLNNNWGDYFSFSEADLYRAHAPEWVFYWGSNMTMANIGNLCNTIAKYNIATNQNAALNRKAAELVHYFHGINPQGLVYLSNMYDYGAERSADEIFHSWFNHDTDWDNAQTSLFGPAPGFLAGGPNQGYTGNLSPPANQPVLKSYLDYNDGFSDVAYEITEPAIYYQAAYIQLLSSYVNTDIVSSVDQIAETENSIKLFPNPFTTELNISSVEKESVIQLYNSQGQLQKILFINKDLGTFNVNGLPNGMYFYEVRNKNHQKIASGKVIRMK